MKRIFVLYTGGTIGMRESAEGLVPDAALAAGALSDFSGYADFTWHVCRPLIDSSAVSPQDWAHWREIVSAALPQHDGVLVLHGTDTMAYTANFFALCLDCGGKPLVLTGAQKPYTHPQSDAPANLHTAVSALLADGAGGVGIAFGGRLYPAVGSSKFTTESDAGFHNPHFGTVREGMPLPQPPRVLPFDAAAAVCSYLLTPGAGSGQIAHALDTFAQDAAVIAAYGHGNAPDDPRLTAAAARFTASGRLLLLVSQTPWGCAADVYAQSGRLRRSGAVAGGKCNIETAVPLLSAAVAGRWTSTELAAALRELGLC